MVHAAVEGGRWKVEVTWTELATPHRAKAANPASSPTENTITCESAANSILGSLPPQRHVCSLSKKCREDSSDQGGRSLDLTLPKIETELRSDTVCTVRNRTDRPHRRRNRHRRRHDRHLFSTNFCRQTVWTLQQLVGSGDLAWHGMAPTCAHSRLEMQDARTHDGERRTFASGTQFHDASILHRSKRTATLPGSCMSGGETLLHGRAASPNAPLQGIFATLGSTTGPQPSCLTQRPP